MDTPTDERPAYHKPELISLSDAEDAKSAPTNCSPSGSSAMEGCSSGNNAYNPCNPGNGAHP
jgi:hypothetical protein